MTWAHGAMLGILIWVALRAISRLSAAESFQIWLLYLVGLVAFPLAPLPGISLFTLTADASIARTATTITPEPNVYWIVSALLAVWVLFRQFAAWRVWLRAGGAGQVRHSDEIKSPTACAWGILLPWDAQQWTQKRLSHVLLHEQAHLSRRDAWVDTFASLVVAACWMQPLAWLALFEMRRLRELAADDSVLLAGSNVFEYAETIHECAVDSKLQPAMAGGGYGHLEERMKHLLDSKAPRRRATWLTAILTTLALAGLMIGMPRLSIAQEKPYDEAPKVIYKIEPTHTDGARDRKISGTVVLSVRIDTDGKARDQKVIRALDHELDLQAMKAVEQWIFEPGRKDGVAVTVRATIEVNFRLK